MTNKRRTRKGRSRLSGAVVSHSSLQQGWFCARQPWVIEITLRWQTGVLPTHTPTHNEEEIKKANVGRKVKMSSLFCRLLLEEKKKRKRKQLLKCSLLCQTALGLFKTRYSPRSEHAAIETLPRNIAGYAGVIALFSILVICAPRSHYNNVAFIYTTVYLQLQFAVSVVSLF